VSAKTLQGYRDTTKRYIVPALGKRPLPAVTRTAVRKLYSDLFERGLSAGTVRAVHRVLSMIMQAAFEDDLIRRNPCHKIKLPSADNSIERGLAPDECRELLA
jgi:site-specific recombinase XerD